MSEQSKQQIKAALVDKLRCRALEARCPECWREVIPIADVKRYAEGLLGIRPLGIPPCPTIARKAEHAKELVEEYRAS